MKPLLVEYAPGTEPHTFWSLRERFVAALCVGYLSFAVAVWLEVFPSASWVAGFLIFIPLLIAALLESPK